MPFAIAAWISLSLVGVLLLVLPEHGSRIFSFSDNHGPSAIDLAGVVALLAGWAVPATVLWRGRRDLWRLGAPAKLGTLIAVLSLIVLSVSVLADLGNWWLLGAASLALIQILAFAVLVRSSNEAGS